MGGINDAFEEVYMDIEIQDGYTQGIVHTFMTLYDISDYQEGRKNLSSINIKSMKIKRRIYCGQKYFEDKYNYYDAVLNEQVL